MYTDQRDLRRSDARSTVSRPLKGGYDHSEDRGFVNRWVTPKRASALSPYADHMSAAFPPTWFWCRMKHCKILSERVPVCPICHVPMRPGTMMEPPTE